VRHTHTHTHTHTHVQVLIAESYGGSDEPVDVLLQSLVATEAVMLDSPLRVKQAPELQLYQQFEEAGA